MIKPVSKHILTCVLLSGAMSSAVLADCGQAPAEPEIPKGAKATMDELKAASQAVKSFIADADTYLDCKLESKEEEMASMSSKEKKRWIKDYERLTKTRNDIPDRFNKQIQAHLKANKS